MGNHTTPKKVLNVISGQTTPPLAGGYFAKFNPHTGKMICEAARSQAEDVRISVESARKAQPQWASLSPVMRGEVLFDLCQRMKNYKRDIAEIVALETGKSFKDALGETDGAIALGMFMAGEGRRYYGYTMTSAVPNKYPMAIREPVGVAALIIAANTPIANVAWKVFPALICGNAAVLKPAEDAPLTSWIFGQIALESDLPKGILNIVHGYGEEAGAPLVNHPEVDLISFTGSSAVGKAIASATAERLVKISLELGGKNPLVVCDDADLENAARWTLLSAFSNAGQRCAAASRIIIFEGIYNKFRDMLVEKTSKLRVGPQDEDDLGPVINKRQLVNILAAVEEAKKEGAAVLVGGCRLEDQGHAGGFYMTPTILENVSPEASISKKELFGPITCLYRVKNFEEALELANRSPYGLTAAIHTANFHRAVEFSRRIRSGAAIVNGGTYGSEPHMPFGGVKQSGNGTREPGHEALNVYSNIKVIHYVADPSRT